MSPTPDSTLDDPQQTIDDLQRQLAERTAERDEALAREAATAEVLGVINSSPGDLAPVFDAMLEKAHSLCGAAHGVLVLRDSENFRAVGVRGLPDGFAERLKSGFPSAGNPIAEPLLAGAPFVQLADVSRIDHPVSQAGASAGLRTVMAAALRKDGVLLGWIVAARREVRAFSDKQIALLQNFAAQAVIAMENARLITETREALEQQTATAEVLGVINSSPGDLAPVFDAMLEKAIRLCGAVYGNLLRYDGELLSIVAAVHADAKAAEWARRIQPFRPTPGGSLDRMLHGEAVTAAEDVKETDAYRVRPEFREMVDRLGYRSILNMALRKDDALLGVISIFREEAGSFSDKQIALLQNFAAQAVIAMENARLITETREALEQQTATAEVLGVISSSPGELAPVFDGILEKAHRLCGITFGSLQLSENGKFRAVAVRGVADSLAELLREPVQSMPGTPAARLADGEAFVQIEDVAEVAKVHPERRRPNASAAHGLHTVLCVPLRKDTNLLGYITGYRDEVRLFSEKEIALLQNFAAQAVIAMENARLITETREALEQQTATAEVLGVINSSPGDLSPVFDAMLDKAIRLCEATHGHLFTYDGDRFHLAGARGEPRYIDWTRQVGPLQPHPDTPLGRIKQGEVIVHIADIREEEVYRIVPMFRESIELRGVYSQITVALVKDNILLGAMNVYRQEVRSFTDKQVALLENFAAQAVIAIENARLITETREALEQQTATAEVLQVINSSPGDLVPVFDAMLDKAMRLCNAACGIICTYDGTLFHPGAARGSADFVERVRRGGPFEAEAGFTFQRVVAGQRVVHIPDVLDTQAYREKVHLQAVAEISRARSLLTVALAKEDQLLGTITVFREEVSPYSEREIALLQNFAAQAVIAMENARLLGELRQRTEEVGELNRDLEARVAAQVDELGRVGRLKRFLAPQLAELIVSHGDEKILESHRREIVVVFCDLRGYTAFTETAEPEEVLEFLRQYHGALGPLVSQFEGTLDQFSGDGIMVFFNDPVPCPDPAERAVKMAVAMREVAGTLIAAWRRRGRMLGFGAGIAQGYATLGQIGFADRSGYTAIGTVCNLAARLCAEAKDGQILIAQLVAVAVEETTPLEEVGELTLKGLTQPVVAYNVPLGAIQPALRVIEGGSPQTV